MNEKYAYEMCKGHPRADKDGFVYTHILVAEKKIGRFLTGDECVHHVDLNKRNNATENIMVFKTQRDHALYHRGYPAKLDGDVYVVEDTRARRICPVCGKTAANKYCSQNCVHEAQKRFDVPVELLIKEVEASSIFAASKKYGVSWHAINKRLQRAKKNGSLQA